MLPQNDEKVKPGYWAVIPASVRYDTRLRPNAKLLYAEISALANAKGFCFAATEYLAENFSVTERSIQTLIKQLEEFGYIRTETVVKGNQHEQEQRRIWLTEPYELANKNSSAAGAGEQNFRAGEQNFRTTLNNINNNIPPIVPQGGQGVPGDASGRKHRKDYKAQADHLPERFERFWTFYCDSIPDDRRKAGNRQKAIKAWDKLSPAPGLIHIMGIALAEQVKGQSWQEGIGIPHASTWLNGHCWEDAAGSGSGAAEQQPKEGWD